MFKFLLRRKLKKRIEYYQGWVNNTFEQKCNRVNDGHSFDSDKIVHLNGQIKYFEGARNAIQDLEKNL